MDNGGNGGMKERYILNNERDRRMALYAVEAAPLGSICEITGSDLKDAIEPSNSEGCAANDVRLSAPASITEKGTK